MKSLKAQLEDKNLIVNKLYKDRDNWKARALAYREIIKRARSLALDDYTGSVVLVLNEADKLDKEPK
ncbi:MAG: hypothetical protein WC497_05500 [Patescibacteria group bacterium]